MIVDASIVVAILKQEADASYYAKILEAQDEIEISAATVLEASLVVGPRAQTKLTKLIHEAGIRVVAFDAAQADIARDAHIRYGRGSGSKARLNFGDCFSYALAKSTGLPLLFKGDDFTHTDLTPAA